MWRQMAALEIFCDVDPRCPMHVLARHDMFATELHLHGGV
jgi:hypothetical protein